MNCLMATRNFPRVITAVLPGKNQDVRSSIAIPGERFDQWRLLQIAEFFKDFPEKTCLIVTYTTAFTFVKGVMTTGSPELDVRLDRKRIGRFEVRTCSMPTQDAVVELGAKQKRFRIHTKLARLIKPPKLHIYEWEITIYSEGPNSPALVSKQTPTITLFANGKVYLGT